MRKALAGGQKIVVLLTEWHRVTLEISQLHDIAGGCIDCSSSEIIVDVSEEECNKCSKTNYPRKMQQDDGWDKCVPDF